ncbi:MAG: cupin domain-containing protein [Terracidiphilus sp.]
MKLSGRAKIGAVCLVCTMAQATHAAFSQPQNATAPHPAKQRARVAFAHALPKLNGDRLRATVVEVNYGPGESSLPHSHPCAVIGYVVEGSIRTQVKGEPEVTVKAGQSFYEAPNGVHLVSANASSSEPAKLLAYLICDHDAPLSVPAAENNHAGGK